MFWMEFRIPGERNGRGCEMKFGDMVKKVGVHPPVGRSVKGRLRNPFGYHV